jgi:hypothetical protein
MITTFRLCLSLLRACSTSKSRNRARCPFILGVPRPLRARAPCPPPQTGRRTAYLVCSSQRKFVPPKESLFLPKKVCSAQRKFVPPKESLFLPKKEAVLEDRKAQYFHSNCSQEFNRVWNRELSRKAAT